LEFSSVFGPHALIVRVVEKDATALGLEELWDNPHKEAHQGFLFE